PCCGRWLRDSGQARPARKRTSVIHGRRTGKGWGTRRGLLKEGRGRKDRGTVGGVDQLAKAGTLRRRASSPSRLSAPGPLAAIIRKPPAIAMFFQNGTNWLASAKLPWNSAAASRENTAIAMAVQ